MKLGMRGAGLIMAISALGALTIPTPVGAQCVLCWPGTSGPCKSANGLCWDYFYGTNICVPGSSPCDGFGGGGGPEPIDCEVGDFTEWSDCDAECGGGWQWRTRPIWRQPDHGGQACPHTDEDRACNTHACTPDPVDCELSAWSAWSDCSKDCGGGSRWRSRHVVTPAANGGAACGHLDEDEACNSHNCPTGGSSSSDAPVDCEVSDWADWSDCSKECGGGTRWRSRYVTVPAAHGGNACPHLDEDEACNSHNCPTGGSSSSDAPVDCAVSEWGDWSECSKPCGGGTRWRSRWVTVHAAHGGQACPPLDQDEACNSYNCPTGGSSSHGSADCDDWDDDLVCDEDDNCPLVHNHDQADSDGDGVGDFCDGCPNDPQCFVNGACGCGVCRMFTTGPCVHNNDGTCVGYFPGTTTCPPGTHPCPSPCPNDPDNDIDSDGVCGDVDNCPHDSNADQADSDGDGIGDICDKCPNDATNDEDDDGVCEDVDNCPNDWNAGQRDKDGDGLGNMCDPCKHDVENDQDGDGECEKWDNCDTIYNPNQEDADWDDIGDVCDDCPYDWDNDWDNDGICGNVDNCPWAANPTQIDTDGDGVGDDCDVCTHDAKDDEDEDGICGNMDNCPTACNPDQTDSDGDGVGDECDECPYDADQWHYSTCGCHTCTLMTSGPCVHDNDGTCVPYLEGSSICPPGSRPCEWSWRRELSESKEAKSAAAPAVPAAEAKAAPAEQVAEAEVEPQMRELRHRDHSFSSGLGSWLLCGDVDSDGDRVPDGCDRCPNDPDQFRPGPCGCHTCKYFTSGPCVHDNDGTCIPYFPGTETCPPGSHACTDPCPNDPDNDIDQDGHCGDVDNCRTMPNPDQANADGDHLGDICDDCPHDADNDADDDTICGDVDNCPSMANKDQVDSDGDGIGDVCDKCPHDADNDADDDGICGDVDNCPATANADQRDRDSDGMGDACDACPDDYYNDADSDGVCGDVDNCPSTANAQQEDDDDDGMGDACDDCPHDAYNDIDDDGICGDVDVCPVDPNPGQEDRDGDGVGDTCDECPDNPHHFVESTCGCGTCNHFTSGPCRHKNDGTCFGYFPGTTWCVPGSEPCNVGERRLQQEREAKAVETLAALKEGRKLEHCSDIDQDGHCDEVDNCIGTPNADQRDMDSDGVGDACDSCATDPRMWYSQRGWCGCHRCALFTSGPCVHNNDGTCISYFPGTETCPPGSSKCDEPCPLDPHRDADNDLICGDVDNCPWVSNPAQADADNDGLGDDCDKCKHDAENDVDRDDLCGDVDNCPHHSNADQTDNDSDGKGDACDACPYDADNDADGDGVCGDVDNCPAAPNAGQRDSDGDGIGDECDVCPFDAHDDADGDGVCGDVDNCPSDGNAGQEDADHDGLGDACDRCANDPHNDSDGDGICGDVDNCPLVRNQHQADRDGDGVGDACDACPLSPNQFEPSVCGCDSCKGFTGGPCTHDNDGSCVPYFPGSTTCPPGSSICRRSDDPVDCQVTGWEDWSECSASCGPGTKTRSRTVSVPARNGGAECPPLTATRDCNLGPCDSGSGSASGSGSGSGSGSTAPVPVDCLVGSWGSWGSCSAECDGGSQTRYRSILRHPENGGTACPSASGLRDTRDCNTHSCPQDSGTGGSGGACSGCWPGSAGPCQGSNTVCFDMWAGVCPAGTSACATTGSLSAEPTVEASVTIAGTGGSLSKRDKQAFKESVAQLLSVPPTHVHVSSVTPAADGGVNVEYLVVAPNNRNPEALGRSEEDIARTVRETAESGAMAEAITAAGVTKSKSAVKTGDINVRKAESTPAAGQQQTAAAPNSEAAGSSSSMVMLVGAAGAGVVVAAAVAALVVKARSGRAAAKHAKRVDSVDSIMAITRNPHAHAGPTTGAAKDEARPAAVVTAWDA